MNTNLTNKKSVSQKVFLGIVLIALGLLIVAAKWIDFGALILVVPGLVMLIWGAFSREAGWIIPGAIVGSIGTGALVIENSGFNFSETKQGAVFLMIFAGGWFLITLLTAFFAKKTLFWALIPGVILAAVGGLLLMGQTGIAILEYSNYIWPIALVLGGGFVIFKAVKR